MVLIRNGHGRKMDPIIRALLHRTKSTIVTMDRLPNRP
jgi:hypothetical protein